MSEKHEDLKEMAGGWIMERKGTDVPGFLKLAFPVIGLGCTAYIVLQMMGDVHHATRGKYVQQFNQVSQTSPTFQYIVAALALIYVVIMLAFTYRAFKED
jgi:Na+/H+ antiporter NhaC